MALQLFRCDAGIEIDDIGSILTGTGVPGSGVNDKTAQTVQQGSFYFQVGPTPKTYQKIGAGATIADWEALSTVADLADLTALRTLTGTLLGATDFGTTFTGSVIPDSADLTTALQSLETYAEATRSLVSNFEWQESVLDRFDPTAALPVAPTASDRYLATATGNGWTNDYIYEWDGAVWIETIPTTGTYLAVDDEPTVLYQYGGASWSAKEFENTTASTGLIKLNNDIQLADANANGVIVSGGVLSLNVDDVTLELAANILQIKALGVNQTHINFGTGANQVSAVDLPIEDLGSLITATNVEDALAEIASANNGIADNTITSPNGSITSSGTIGADNQTVDVVFSVLGEANRSIQASDLSSTANALGASLIGVEDADGDYTATTQEGVNAEIGDRLLVLEASVPAAQVDFIGVTGGATTTLATVPLADALEVEYKIVITEDGTGDRESFTTSIMHNGTTADHNKYAGLKLGKVNGLSVSSSVVGTDMVLSITASSGYSVSIKEIDRVTA